MKKLLKWSAAGIAVIVVVLVLFIFFGLNPIVRARVTDSGTHATGQTTTLGDVDLSLMDGTLKLTGLDIANPAGYKTPQFLTMNSCNIKVQPRTLLGSTVAVDEIAIDGLNLTVEQNGLTNNLADVLAVIQKQTSAGSSGPQDSGKPAAPGKQLKIAVLRLAGTKVHITGLTDMTLDLGPIEIKEPTNPDGRPMKIADVFGKVLINVAQQIAQDPKIPGNLKDSLKNVNQLVGDLRKNIPLDPKDTKALEDLFKKK